MSPSTRKAQNAGRLRSPLPLLRRRAREGVVLAAVLLTAAALPAATIRKADDTIVTGRVVGIRGDKLIVAQASTQPVGKPVPPTSSVPTPTPPPSGGPARTMSQRLFPTRRPAATGPATQPAAATRPVDAPTVTAPPAPKPVAVAAPASQPGETEIPLEDVAEIAPLFEPGAAAVAAPGVEGVITNPSAPADNRPWKLKLVDGQSLTVQSGQWSNGNLCGTVLGGKLTLAVPATFVAEWWCGANDQLKAAAALNEAPGLEDIAYAARDKSVLAVRGVAVGMDGASLKFKYGGEERSIALGRLVGVVFARSPDTTSRTQPIQVVTVAGNEQFTGTLTGLDDNIATFTTTWGQTVRLARTDINKLSFRNGRVVGLSDLTPVDVKQTPYFDRLLPWQADTTLDGKPLQLDGLVLRGIAMHSQTALTYALNGEFAEFKAKVGFEQPAGRLGDVVLRVRGDGKTLLEKPSFKGTDKPTDLTVNVAGVQKLSIEVDFGDGQDVGDRVIWAAPRVIRPAK